MNNDEMRLYLLTELRQSCEELSQKDPVATKVKREPWAFTLMRQGHFFEYRAGPWDTEVSEHMGRGEILWRPGSSHPDPYSFRIVRDQVDSLKLHVNDGPPMTVNEVIDEVIGVFVNVGA